LRGGEEAEKDGSMALKQLPPGQSHHPDCWNGECVCEWYNQQRRAMTVEEFGVKIPWSFDVASPVFLNSDHMRRLQAARDYVLDWQAAYTFHTMHGVDPTCYFCSWVYKFYHFWHEIEFWSGECGGCEKPMYECGQTCALWEDY
jgi:hypothetical protein